MKRGVVDSISEEWLRVILLESEVSHQSLRTWKESHDPEREVKKAYIEKLTRMPHNPPVVLSGDEIGPIQLIPQGGSGWFPQGTARTDPAEYHKEFGTTYYFLMLNVYHQQLSGQVVPTKHAVRWLEFLKEERAKYPADQAGVHRPGRAQLALDAEIRWWARLNNVVLVPSATHASWMNPVETHARDLEELALPGDALHDGGGGRRGVGRGGGVSERGADPSGKKTPGHRSEEPTAPSADPRSGSEPRSPKLLHHRPLVARSGEQLVRTLWAIVVESARPRTRSLPAEKKPFDGVLDASPAGRDGSLRQSGNCFITPRARFGSYGKRVREEKQCRRRNAPRARTPRRRRRSQRHGLRVLRCWSRTAGKRGTGIRRS